MLVVEVAVVVLKVEEFHMPLLLLLLLMEYHIFYNVRMNNFFHMDSKKSSFAVF